jgi:hypothetical protein
MAPYLIAGRIHHSLTNDIRRGHNSHRQGDLYRASSCCYAHRPRHPLGCDGGFSYTVGGPQNGGSINDG